MSYHTAEPFLILQSQCHEAMSTQLKVVVMGPKTQRHDRCSLGPPLRYHHPPLHRKFLISQTGFSSTRNCMSLLNNGISQLWSNMCYQSWKTCSRIARNGPPVPSASSTFSDMSTVTLPRITLLVSKSSYELLLCVNYLQTSSP